MSFCVGVSVCRCFRVSAVRDSGSVCRCASVTVCFSVSVSLRVSFCLCVFFFVCLCVGVSILLCVFVSSSFGGWLSRRLGFSYPYFSMVKKRPRSVSRACAARSAASCHACGLLCVCSAPDLVEKMATKGLTHITLPDF